MSVTYAVTVCNELLEVSKLLNFLQLHIQDIDEILIQYDEGNSTDEVVSYIKILDKLHENVRTVGFPLNGNFASFKNNLTKHSTKDYIVSIDADEIPTINFIENLPRVLESNPVDLIFVPRINTVDGITRHHISKYGWNISKLETQINEKEIDINSEEYELLKYYNLIIEENNGTVKYYKPIINAWDYQTRVYRRTDDILWVGTVHETITGYNNFSNFPADEDWCLYHHKDIIRQTQQNEKYSKMTT